MFCSSLLAQTRGGSVSFLWLPPQTEKKSLEEQMMAASTSLIVNRIGEPLRLMLTRMT